MRPVEIVDIKAKRFAFESEELESDTNFDVLLLPYNGSFWCEIYVGEYDEYGGLKHKEPIVTGHIAEVKELLSAILKWLEEVEGDLR